MKSRLQSAFTLIEMLVVISIIAILAAFAVPALTSALTKGQMTGTMNNGRQMYLAAQQMALDGSANSDPNLGWPTDVGDTTLNAYVTRLVTQNYLKVGDVQKLLSGPGASAQVTSSTAGTPPVTTITVTGTAALKIYPVADADASNVIFATSRNYTYNSVLTPTTGGATPVANNPFGDKGFIVQRKGGDASVLRPNNATDGGNITQFESQVGKKPGEAQGTASAGDPGGVLKQP